MKNNNNVSSVRSEVIRSNDHQKQISSDIEKLMLNIEYQFKDVSLLNMALTHKSYNSQLSYERLEFLGDALLGLVIGEYLYTNFPNDKEGVLTRMRSKIVRQPSLAIVAHDLKIPKNVILGIGERKAGGNQKPSILSDVVEAIIGAIYLDSNDIEVVRLCILSWFKNLLHDVSSEKIVLKDAKSRLQELLQAHKFGLPKYKLQHTEGHAPNQLFTVSCSVDVGKTITITQTGKSIRIAEQKSAELMIAKIEYLNV